MNANTETPRQRWTPSVLLALAVASILVLLFAPGAGWNTVLFIVASAVLAAVFDALRRRYEASLIRRIEADAPLNWVASLNGIEIGTVSDAQMAAMQRDALRNLSNVLGQALECVRFGLKAAGLMLVVVPVCLFWYLAVVAIVAPESILETAAGLYSATPADMAAFGGALLRLGVILAVVLMGVASAVCGRIPGLKMTNCYSLDVSRALRRHFRTPVDGKFDFYQTGA